MSLYWSLVLLATIATWVWGIPGWGEAGRSVWALVLGLPAVLLAAAAAAGLLIAVVPLPEKSARFLRLAKITAGILVGTAIGVGVMFLSCGLPSGLFN